MKLQRKASVASIILAAAWSLRLSPAGAQTPASPKSLDGLWVSDGYGDFLEFQQDSLRTYEITTLK